MCGTVVVKRSQFTHKLWSVMYELSARVGDIPSPFFCPQPTLDLQKHWHY